MPRATDEAAFRQLVHEQAAYVWRVLRSLGVSPSDLQDVSQETFIVVLRQLPTFEERSSLRSWIYGIALRVASDYRSKAYRRRERATELPPEVAVAADQQGQLERAAAWRFVDGLLAELDEDRRRVFVLYELEQLPMREVAAIVGCPLSTAYSRLHTARDLIQARLEQQRKEGCTP
ncbi:MAG: hypothetical protein JWN48_4816 [Myxococcaceae bacterium]|nr:hypothetical protein [Myxococcaceae bacterium]